MNTPSEVVSEHDDESRGKSKPWSAYILGYNSVMVRVWQRVFWHMPDPEWGTRDSVPLCLEQLEEALTCLADEVVPEVRRKIQGPLDGLRELHTAMVEALQPESLSNAFSFGSQPIPGEEEWRNLLFLAAWALRKDDGLRAFYSFGAAIGRYQLQLDPRDQSGKLPSLEEIQSCTQAMDFSTVEAVSEFKMLAMSAMESAGEAQPTLLGRIVGFESGDAVFDADLDEWGRFLVLKRMTKLNYDIQEKLRGLSDAGGERSQECAENARTSHVRLPAPFVPTWLQRKVLEALEGKGKTKQVLADELLAGEFSRLYKAGGINELKSLGLVVNKRGVGYYRPDAPPPGAMYLSEPNRH